MNQILVDLFTNIKCGIQLCIFRRLNLEVFRVSLDQFALLVLVNILMDSCHDYLANLPNPSFNPNAIPGEAFSIVMLVFACYVISRVFFHQEIMNSLTVVILSICPPLTLVWGMVNWRLTNFPEDLGANGWVSGFYTVWVFSVLFLSIRTIADRISRNVVFAFLILIGIWLAPVEYYASDHSFWNSREEESEQFDDPYEAYKSLDVEGMYYAQPLLLNQALQSLHPGQVGKKDVFFIGVGAWALQDVFLKEVMYAKNLFDHRFESQKRSLVLVNHLSTYDAIPLASSHNLNKALDYMGTIMNREEDLLILYMTSHGTKDHKLSVNFWPLGLNDISPTMLRQYLDKAGIKWRVIMVSACYSGGFIEPLKTPYTAIASAAAPDRKSFGCGNKSEFTYFGEALLKDQLQEVYSFPLAFSGAIRAIGERESSENLDASFPQSFIGDEMKIYLNEFSDYLKRKAQIKIASDS